METAQRTFNCSAVCFVYFQDEYIFVTEQTGMSILILNKTTEIYIKKVNAAIFDDQAAIPFDLIMYDSSRQKLTPSEQACYIIVIIIIIIIIIISTCC